MVNLVYLNGLLVHLAIHRTTFIAVGLACWL